MTQIRRHIGMRPEAITIVSADTHGRQVAAADGVRFFVAALLAENYWQLLDPLVGRGDFVLNVAADQVRSALIWRGYGLS